LVSDEHARWLEKWYPSPVTPVFMRVVFHKEFVGAAVDKFLGRQILS